MSKPTRLSKSRFLSGDQCHLRLWYDFHASFRSDETSESQLAVFNTGHEVGELACERYPRGHLIAHDHRHFNDALSETDELLEDETIPALFEAAFEFEGLTTRADVIERLQENSWRLIEVKSTTKVKPVHVLDFAFQLHILRSAGMDVPEGGVLTLDTSYVFDGKTLDLDALFQLHDVVDDVEELLETIQERTSEMQSVIASEEPPEIEPGDHCFTPYLCPYYGDCTKDMQLPEHGLNEIPRLSKKRQDELGDKKIVEICDIPAEFPLTAQQQIVRTAVIEDREIVNHEQLSKFDALEQPIRHLDFETFSPAIPRFASTSPYDAIPFLFSIHMERKGLVPAHTDYLHEGSDDPRPELANRLIKAVGSSGAICTFGHYERGVVNALIEALPDREDELRAIKERLVDLCRLMQHAYYHPDFRGSFSLKSVFPVLCPEEGYEDLAIAEGRLAALRYMHALQTNDSKERHSIFKELREYCKRDTLATLRIRQVLTKKAQSETPA